jgi:hypothetical protein
MQLQSVILGCIGYRRSFATVTCLLQLHKSIRFADVQHPLAPTPLRSQFSPQISFFFFHHFSVTWNFTIDDGLELEIDKMVTSFGAAALPQHRLRAVRLDSFSATQRHQFWCTQIYLAASFTAARSPLSLHCSNCIIPYYALSTFNTLLLEPDALPTPIDRLLRVAFFLSFFKKFVHWPSHGTSR